MFRHAYGNRCVPAKSCDLMETIKHQNDIRGSTNRRSTRQYYGQNVSKSQRSLTFRLFTERTPLRLRNLVLNDNAIVVI